MIKMKRLLLLIGCAVSLATAAGCCHAPYGGGCYSGGCGYQPYGGGGGVYPQGAYYGGTSMQAAVPYAPYATATAPVNPLPTY